MDIKSFTGAMFGVFATFFIQPVNSATVTFYDDLSLFMAATTTTLIDFEGIVADNERTNFINPIIVDGVTFGAPTGTFAVAGKDASLSGSPYESALLASINSSPITADLTTVDQTTADSEFTAVGGFFGDINSSGTLTTMTLIGTTGVLDTRSLITADMGFGLTHNFFGWTVSGDTILSLTHDLDGNYEGIDDFRYGTVVPVPAAVWLFGSGLLGLIGFARRKR